jgi:hypothetical protein
MNLKQYAALISSAIAFIVAVIAAIVAIKSEDKSDDLVAIADVMVQSSQVAEASAVVAIAGGDRSACIAAKSVAALTATAAGAITSAASDDGVCEIPAMEIDASACPAKAAEVTPVDGVELAGAAEAPTVDAMAVVETAIGPAVDALTGIAGGLENKAAGVWVGAALDFVNGGRKSIILLVEDPESGKISVPGVIVQDCRAE